MAERNYYILLEVKNTATFEEIKSSYRVLAKKYHPDKNIGNKAAEEYFKEIQQAYTILSNPEKRKKYDLKFSYSTQQRSYSSGPQYNGNAYQYAQQQAQARQQPFSTQKKQPPIKENRESWQIIVSVGIALVLLYFIISYSTEKTTASTKNNQAVPEKIVEKTIEPQEELINNFDSPYSSFFGDEISDSESKNSLTIFNSNSSEAVVCLIEKDAPNRTIRNQYMNRNTEFKMNEVPDGKYFLKVYFGKGWNPDKTFLKNTIKGGFNIEEGFIKLNSGTESLIMKKEKNGSSFSYSTYEIMINVDDKQDFISISPEDFFKK